MYTAKEVAEILRCNPVTILRKIHKGEIKAIKFGKGWKISKEELERIKRGE